MKEVVLRKWHRKVGMILAIFLLVQAGTGLLISFGDLVTPPGHADSDPANPSEGAKDTAAPPDQKQMSATTSHESEEEENLFMEIMDALHHGGGAVGGCYRIALGIVVILQVALGGFISRKISQRAKGSQAKAS